MIKVGSKYIFINKQFPSIYGQVCEVIEHMYDNKYIVKFNNRVVFATDRIMVYDRELEAL